MGDQPDITDLLQARDTQGTQWLQKARVPDTGPGSDQARHKRAKGCGENQGPRPHSPRTLAKASHRPTHPTPRVEAACPSTLPRPGQSMLGWREQRQIAHGHGIQLPRKGCLHGASLPPWPPMSHPDPWQYPLAQSGVEFKFEQRVDSHISIHHRRVPHMHTLALTRLIHIRAEVGCIPPPTCLPDCCQLSPPASISGHGHLLHQMVLQRQAHPHHPQGRPPSL